MECNRDEALRSLDIAEKKFSVQDYTGCKKFVIKAQQLFPALEGAAQMLAVVEVLSIAQQRTHGSEHDWYGMLQVDPYADDATIRKQYRKLALTLHPDKNKSAGAESAFKLIGEAWGVLSDRDRRFKYNEKRGIKPHQNPNFNQAQGLNGFNNLHQASSSAAPRPYATATFWTSCPYCKMQYQYFRTYENFHLLCQKCKRGYVARDVNAMNVNGGNATAFPWSNVYGNFGPHFRPPESLYTKFAANANVGGSFANGFVNGNVYSQMGSGSPATATSATAASAAAAAAAAAATSMAGAAANTTMAGAAATSTSVGANSVAAEYVRQMYQKAKKDRIDAQREEKRKEKEKERLEREREKEERRKEREAQKKLREDQKRREAMLKLSMKQREMEEREAARRKKAEKSKTKSKKYDSGEEEDTDEDEIMDENEDEVEALERMLSKDHDAALGEEALKVEVRRSSRMRRNVSYRFDGSDDDAEASPRLKKPKLESDVGFERGPLGCQSQIPNDGFTQKIRETSTLSGGAMCDGIHADELHKMELGGKFRTYLREYVLPSLNRSNNVVKADVRSQKKGNSIKKDVQKVASEKSKLSTSENLGSQTKVKVSEHLEPSQLPVSQGDTDGVAADQEQAGLEIPPPSPSKPDDEEVSLKNMTVPDPDFHNFDGDRTETKVAMGQIWAVYDDQDGMPRFYCRILRVLSSDPFKVRVRWLDADQSSKDVTKWIDTDHLLTCGEFKNSFSYETFEHINVFSHVMLADVSQKGLIKIYPKKGEVWALYRGWTQEWFQKDMDQDERKYSYDMVEVVSDFSDETGVGMIPLIKVHGFKTLFEQQALKDYDENFHCPPREIFRFSHRVPAHRKTGLEAPNVPEGCWELDPASTPLELIYGQVHDNQRFEQS